MYPPESNSTFYCVVDRFRCNPLIMPPKYINLIKYIKNTYLPPVTLRIPVNSLRYGYLPCFAGNKEATLSQPLIITMQPDKVKNSLPEYYRRDGRC
ncbi:hypothetical protein CI707_20330 [Shigella sonnei]|nr:hypothetical protein [Salmonella enterica subsp. enterica serovar Heidelberg]EEV5626984.1 hypothetical protein [Escherichia coli]PBP03003.1 hypothetical protein CI707_20330 [Shigella sonnei]EBS0327066.1 hypothetical protein [Salmonella enterica subsp. enterica serovar Heidelberg]EBS0535518.1 hypothetical protein [Salmonella enterica subsp. enterica serovar Heidelberg]